MIPPVIMRNSKKALLNSYKLNEEFYRKDFRNARAQPDSTFQQFGIDLARKFDYWTKSVEVKEDFASLKNFMIVDQFLASVPPDVRVFLREHNIKSKTLSEITALADDYGNAHPNVFKFPSNPKYEEQPIDKREPENTVKPDFYFDTPRIKCFSCGEVGHRKSSCPRNPSAL